MFLRHLAQAPAIDRSLPLLKYSKTKATFRILFVEALPVMVCL